MKEFVSQSLEDTQKIAAEWLHDISSAKKSKNINNEAVVVGLSGHLGAGKTAFVKCVAKELGIQTEITSPTFVIMKNYEIPLKSSGHTPDHLLKSAQSDFIQRFSIPWNRLVHIDAYRLEKPEELEALRFEDVVGSADSLVLVEWPEQVGLEKILEHQRISFEVNENTRTIKIAEFKQIGIF